MISEESIARWHQRNRTLIRSWLVEALPPNLRCYAMDAEFEEAEHPRDEGGKFAKKGASDMGTPDKAHHLSSVLSGSLDTVSGIKEFARQAVEHGIGLNNKDVEEFGERAYNASMKKGERHNGFYRANGGDTGGKFAVKTASKSMRSMKRQMDEHLRRINNPEGYDKSFGTYSKEKQDNIIKNWKDDIIRHVEQYFVARHIAKKWGGDGR